MRVAGVAELDRLAALVAIRRRHHGQAGDDANAVVFVDDDVADADLVQFEYGRGRSGRSGVVAFCPTAKQIGGGNDEYAFATKSALGGHGEGQHGARLGGKQPGPAGDRRRRLLQDSGDAALEKAEIALAAEKANTLTRIDCGADGGRESAGGGAAFHEVRGRLANAGEVECVTAGERRLPCRGHDRIVDSALGTATDGVGGKREKATAAILRRGGDRQPGARQVFE